MVAILLNTNCALVSLVIRFPFLYQLYDKLVCSGFATIETIFCDPAQIFTAAGCCVIVGPLVITVNFPKPDCLIPQALEACKE